LFRGCQIPSRMAALLALLSAVWFALQQRGRCTPAHRGTGLPGAEPARAVAAPA